MQGRVNKTHAVLSPSNRFPLPFAAEGFSRFSSLPFGSFSPAFRRLSPTADLITFYIYRSSRCYFGFETLVTDMERLHYSESEHRGPLHTENKNAVVNPMEEGISHRQHGRSRG